MAAVSKSCCSPRTAEVVYTRGLEGREAFAKPSMPEGRIGGRMDEKGGAGTRPCHLKHGLRVIVYRGNFPNDQIGGDGQNGSQFADIGRPSRLFHLGSSIHAPSSIY